MENEGIGLPDLTGLIRRRARLVGLTFMGISLLSLVAAYSLDNLYQSSGTIIIERQEVSNKYLPGAFSDTNPEQRIQRIYDEVMTRTNIGKIIEDRGLYAAERGDAGPESVVSIFRQNFEMELRLSGDDPRSRDTGEVTGLELSFFHTDPETARNVARDVVALFQEGNRQSRQAAYVETTGALERESDNFRDQVAEFERQLAEFKSQNPGALPEDRNYNRQSVERKARDLDGLDREIRSLQERKTLLQTQLAQTEPWVTTVGLSGETLPTTNEQLRSKQAEYLRLLGIYNAIHPDVQRIKREIDSLAGGTVSPAFRQAIESQLASTRLELAAARRDYAEDHPDRRNLERAVAALEAEIADMPAESADLPAPNNPTYLNLQVQLQGVNNELIALRADRRALQDETQELDRMVQFAPEVERRYLELTRDLGLARDQYEDSKSRLMSVQRAGNLEEDELAERYVVTRYPSLPYKPAFPNRPLFLAIGIFLGLTTGLLVGIASEALDSTIRNTRDIRMILGMPPIAAIPEINTINDKLKARRSRLIYAASIGIVIVAAAAYVQMQRSSMI